MKILSSKEQSKILHLCKLIHIEFLKRDMGFEYSDAYNNLDEIVYLTNPQSAAARYRALIEDFLDSKEYEDVCRKQTQYWKKINL